MTSTTMMPVVIDGHDGSRDEAKQSLVREYLTQTSYCQDASALAMQGYVPLHEIKGGPGQQPGYRCVVYSFAGVPEVRHLPQTPEVDARENMIGGFVILGVLALVVLPAFLVAIHMMSSVPSLPSL